MWVASCDDGKSRDSTGSCLRNELSISRTRASVCLQDQNKAPLQVQKTLQTTKAPRSKFQKLKFSQLRFDLDITSILRFES
jgi:hypothetical protein